MNTVDERLARIETKLDVWLISHEKTHDDHEGRIRGLERFRWLWAGAAGLLGAGGFEVFAKMIGA